MKITIDESGLCFGEYEKSQLFHAEKSAAYISLGKGVATVEFVLYKKDDNIFMVEAKSSSPQPSNQADFDSFIDEIFIKVAHSIDLYFGLVLKRIHDSANDMPDCFKTADYSKANIKFVLVINGHRTEWLPPITDALTRKLKRQIKTWGLDVVAINHLQAREYGLLKC
ncbi:hypothetical protein [Marasmitruncus massiliensis]|uniref:hypothetical protein n=1 Tax=Marasmitruncus massiliensis TaxID=1944642 RepID=UPI000C7DC6B8|nr:hypothetical protein [Marasmitruncus massiliensis]